MTRQELIEKLLLQFPEVAEGEMDQAVKVLFETMVQGLLDGQRIEIRGFGSFMLKHREARVARNPKTGACVQAEARHVLRFRAGKELKERVNDAFLNQQGASS